jgi:hypothetical protein
VISSAASGAAVIDVGSARTKMTLAHQINGQVKITKFKEETGLAATLDENGEIPPSAVDLLGTSLRRLRRIALDANCDAIVTVATEALRRARNCESVMASLSKACGDLSLLSPSQEGHIFWHSIRAQISRRAPFCLLDVGGGSVQAIWGDAADQVKSIPTGTFLLERQFQTNSPPRANEYEAMREFIRKSIAESLPQGLHFDLLAVGSNCMEEFFVSALARAGLRLSLKDEGKATIPADLSRLYNEISGQPYELLGEYYPANPHFMYGADKALLIILEFCKTLGTQSVWPTNESVSTALARLVLQPEQRAVLLQYGIIISRLAC